MPACVSPALVESWSLRVIVVKTVPIIDHGDGAAGRADEAVAEL